MRAWRTAVTGERTAADTILREDEQGDGSYTVTFKTLFDDDTLANQLEALVGTLKAAKKRGVLSYKAELLMQGMSDKEVITLHA